MRSSCVCAAVAVLACTGTVMAETVDLDLGLFRNAGSGAIEYTGPWGASVSSSLPGNTNHTLITVDLAEILGTIGAVGLQGVSIVDSGTNPYGDLSPGADLDYLAFDGLTTLSFPVLSYAGPNGAHGNETPGDLATRLAEIDWFTGADDPATMRHVALDAGGRLSAMFEEPILLAHGNSPSLLLSEAGTVGPYETFHVHVHGLVPTPGTLALLGVAALVVGHHRRQR